MSRPRLVVPGVVEVVVLDGGRGLVDIGPLCDVAPMEPAHEEPGQLTLIPRSAAPHALASALDLTDFTHVAERLARVRWVLGEPNKDSTPWLRLSAGRFDGRYRDESGVERSFIAKQAALWALAFGDDPPADDQVPALHDRCIAALTSGVLSLRDVELARWAAGLSPDMLPVEERILAEVAERAEGQRDEAAALVAAVARLGAQPGEVPVYGQITCVRCPAFVLDNIEGITVEGGPIAVPEACAWLVEDVEPWEPGAALLRRQATFSQWQSEVRKARDAGKRKERRLWMLIGAVLVAGIGVLVLGQLALGWLGPADSDPTDRAVGEQAP